MNDVVGRLQKNDFAITKLVITDEFGTPIEKPYKLKEGANTFKCLAIYNDGSSVPFSPYWTCPIILNRRQVIDGRLQHSIDIDVWGVLGQTKREEATINASQNHARYTELACWVFPPKKETPTGNAEIPHDSTGFDYSLIDQLTQAS